MPIAFCMFGQGGLARPVIIMLLLGTTALAILAPRAALGDSTSALDALGTRISCQMHGCLAESITTSQGNDVIFVTIGPATNVSQLSDSSGLAFTQRLSYTQTTYNFTVWEYYAVARAPLSSDNITAVVDSCCGPKDGMQVIAVHGADPNALFDPNPTTPATVSCSFNGTYYAGPTCGHCLANYNTMPGPCSASIQTSRTDFVIATTVINDAGPCRGGNSTSPAANQPPIGFTIAGKTGNFEVDYAQTTTSQTTVSFNCYGTDATAIVLDTVAIMPAPVTTDPPSVAVSAGGGGGSAPRPI